MFQNKRVLVLFVALVAFFIPLGIVTAQGPTPRGVRAPRANVGNAFMYQGQLKRNGSPTTSTCDFQFNLWSDAAGTVAVGSNPQIASAVNVANGLFTVKIDFGAGAFTGDARWMGTSVKCTGDSSFTALLPLEQLTPVPMALSLPGLYTQQNSTSPNIIGGYSGNTVSNGVTGATISGGGANGTINQITANNATIGGGVFNSALGVGSTIGGGGDDGNAPSGNYAQGNASTIGGGLGNTIQVSGTYATIGGGTANLAHGYASFVGGGYQNNAQADYSTVAGGLGNNANGIGSFIGGGGTTGPVAANVANGNGSSIVGGEGNFILITGTMATIGGGYSNTAGGIDSTVSGGFGNKALYSSATIGGGGNNLNTGYYATISGGQQNTATGSHAAIPGGIYNVAQGDYSFAAGYWAQALHNNTFVWSDQSLLTSFSSTAPNQFLIRSAGGVGINTNSPVGALNVNGTTWFQGDTTPLPSSAGKGVGIGFLSAFNAGYIFAYDYAAPSQQNLVLNAPGGNVGIGTLTPNASLDVNGTLRVRNLSNGVSSTTLCFTPDGYITACSSSIRYKTNIADLNLGLDAVAKLRPVTYDWKADGQPDLGFVAEEVNQVTPLLTFLNKDGQIEGVKYDRITAILVKGMQEQQTQIAELKATNAAQQDQIAQLKQDNADIKARVSALEQTVQANNVGTHSDNTGNIAMIVVGALLGIVVSQKPWRRGQ